MDWRTVVKPLTPPYCQLWKRWNMLLQVQTRSVDISYKEVTSVLTCIAWVYKCLDWFCVSIDIQAYWLVSCGYTSVTTDIAWVYKCLDWYCVSIQVLRRYINDTETYIKKLHNRFKFWEMNTRNSMNLKGIFSLRSRPIFKESLM